MPTALAEPWDNVGLLAGDPMAEVSGVMPCIDATREVIAEAAASSCQLVVAYHPPTLKGVRTLLAGSVLYDAVRAGISIWTPHTALDAVQGGTNDVLCDAMGVTSRRPLRPSPTTSRHCKLVTFVPVEHAEGVASAVFAAGAGRIGDYTECSFRSDGTGTYFGGEGTSPAVGQPGRRESVPELRLETVVPLGRVGAALAALRASHPYEEPAFDLVPLAAPPGSAGAGRIGTLPEGSTRRDTIERVREALGLDHVLVAGPLDGPATTAAACAGSCGDLLDEALGQGAEILLTGEMRHHDALRAAAAGMTVMATLHSRSERGALGVLAAWIREAAPALEVRLSRQDRDPFAIL